MSHPAAPVLARVVGFELAPGRTIVGAVRLRHERLGDSDGDEVIEVRRARWPGRWPPELGDEAWIIPGRWLHFWSAGQLVPAPAARKRATR